MDLSSPFTAETSRDASGAHLGNVDPKPHPQTVRKRNRHSETQWKEIHKHLRRIYIEKKNTAEEVQFAMSVIHGFEAS